MPRIKINILNKGDSVLFVNDRMIAVQRKNGEVDLIPMVLDNETNFPRIEIDNILTIAYGKNTVETIIDGDKGDVRVTTF